MTHKIDFPTASSNTVVEALGKRLDQIRLSRNIPQYELAREAGISRSTLTRLANGRPISLDSFVRIMQALHLSDHLYGLLPDPGIRPVDRVHLKGKERQRARKKHDKLSEWTWGNNKEN